MDPRVAARRRQVRVENMHRRRRRIVGLLVVAAVVGVTVAAVRSPLFSVTGVRVTGAPAGDAKHVRAAADVAVGQNLLDVDLAEVERDVEQLPWVASVVARREPPATVAVHVRRRVPVATVTWSGGAAVVAADGAVISATADRSLPRIEAPSAVIPPPGDRIVDPAVLEALEVHAALSSPLRSRVDRYRVGEAGYVLAELDLGARSERIVHVRFGGVSRLGEKEQSLMALLVRLRRDRALSDGVTIDVRAPSNPVVAAF